MVIFVPVRNKEMKKIKYWSGVVLACIFSVSQLFAAQRKEADPNGFQASFVSVCESLDAVGAWAIVVDGAKKICSGGYGLSDKSFEIPFSADRLARVDDASGLIAAIAMMQLAEKGKLDMDSDISGYLGFPVRNPRYPAIAITPRMLLNHTSTLASPAGFVDPSYLDKRHNSQYDSVFLKKGKPGKKENRISQNTDLAAVIVEKVSGKRYDVYVKENILSPLGIEGGFDPAEFSREQLARSYTWDVKNQSYFNQFRAYPSIDYSGYSIGKSTFSLRPSSMLLSADGLAQIIATLFNDGLCPDTSNRILSASSVKTIFSPYSRRGHATPGFYVNTTAVPDYILLTAVGEIYGTSTAVYLNVKDKIAVVAICNGAHNDQPDSNGIIGNDFNREIRKIFVKYIVR